MCQSGTYGNVRLRYFHLVLFSPGSSTLYGTITSRGVANFYHLGKEINILFIPLNGIVLPYVRLVSFARFPFIN